MSSEILEPAGLVAATSHSRTLGRSGPGTTRRGLVRVLPGGILLAAIGTALGFAGFYSMFSQFQTYDDEGYWLISLQQFSMHGGLYNRTYTQCGPFYYEFWSTIIRVLGLPYTLDTGRFLTLGAWASASLLFAFGTWILTKKLSIAVLVELFTFLVLYSLVPVPMEPAGLSYVLFAIAVIGIGIFDRGFQLSGVGLIGVSVAALALTKINIGALALIGLVSAILISWPSTRPNVTKWTGLILSLAAGTFLMISVVNEQWVQMLLAFFIFTIGGVSAHLLFRDTAEPTLTKSVLLVGIFAAGITGVIVILIAVLSGSAIPQLVYGAFLGQRNLAAIFQIPPHISLLIVLYAVEVTLISLFTVAAWRRPDIRPWFYSPLSGVLRIAAASWMFWSMLPFFTVFAPPGSGKSFLLAAPLVWLALLPPIRKSNEAIPFARVALVFASVMECLETFPVAGTQFAWASMGIIPVSAVCLADGLVLVTSSQLSNLRLPKQLAISENFGRLFGKLVVALITVLTLWVSSSFFENDKALYQSNSALSSPGAELIHLPSYLQHSMNSVSTYLRRNCSTFESFPGLNSFYLLSGEMPPTGLNTTQWMKLLSLQQQAYVMKRLKHYSNLCVIEDLSLLPFWDQNRPLRRTPLVNYLRFHFSTEIIYPPYRIELPIANSG